MYRKEFSRQGKPWRIRYSVEKNKDSGEPRLAGAKTTLDVGSLESAPYGKAQWHIFPMEPGCWGLRIGPPWEGSNAGISSGNPSIFCEPRLAEVILALDGWGLDSACISDGKASILVS